jgi:hypothetical protein
MVQKVQFQPRRTDQEWLELIQQCHTNTAIRLTNHGIRIEITNSAAGESITSTLTALQRLC